MMDKTYILSEGLLERYVLGELDIDEQNQVEKALEIYPELQKSLEAIEITFEKVAFENAKTPSEVVKSKLLEKISNSNSKNVIPSIKDKSVRSLKFISGIAAALLIGSIFLFMQWNSVQKELQLASEKNKELNEKLDQLINENNATNQWYAMISNPNTEKYILKGNQLMPEATVISYVNDKEKSVVVNTSYLPKLEEDQDYQMWADVEGEMINMGIIKTENKMLAMNYIENSESLNITIEPSGGSDHPTVSKLITNIYIK